MSNKFLTVSISAAVLVLSTIYVDTPVVEAAAIEEIVVTARKREESLQDVPVAIQAFQTDQIEKYAATDLNLIADMANNVEISMRGSNGGGGTLAIRGMGASAGDAGIDASVAVNIDGVQSNRGWVSHMGFYDMQSIQILKGPQALFYGKDSPAGVVGTISAAPTDEFEAKIKVGYETEADEQIIEAMVSGPLTDTLNGRVFVRTSSMDGWIKNNAQRTPVDPTHPYFASEPYDLPGGLTSPGADDVKFFRIGLDWAPTDNFDAEFRLHNMRIVSEGFAIGEIGRCSVLGDQLDPSGTIVYIQPIFGAVFGGPYVDPYNDCRQNQQVSQGSIAPEITSTWSHINANSEGGELWGKSDSRLISLKLGYDLGWAELESITGYFKYDARGLDNFGGALYPAMLGYNPDRQITRSQEIRLITNFDGAVNFMVGAYYDEFKRWHTAAVKLGVFGPDPDAGYGNDLDVRQKSWGSSRAYFGQIIWNINEEWELTAGARYTDDRKASNQFNFYVHRNYEDLGALLFGPFGSGLIPSLWRDEGVPLYAAFSDTQTSPEVTLTWRPNNDHTFWAAYKTGYKGGGISNPTLLNNGDTAADMIFLPEEADGFEIGSKSMFMEGRLRLNITLYDYEFENLQVTTLDTVTTTFSIGNAGVATTRGIEFDLEYLATDSLTLRAEFGYNKAEYDEYIAPCYEFQPVGPSDCMDLNGDSVGDAQDLAGNPLTASPEWSGSFGFEYERPVGDNWGLYWALTGQYRDEALGSTDGNPFSVQDSRFQTHTRIGIFSQDGRWDFHFIGRNLTDERGDPAGARPAGLSALDSGVELMAGTGRGRQYLFELTRNW